MGEIFITLSIFRVLVRLKLGLIFKTVSSKIELNPTNHKFFNLIS